MYKEFFGLKEYPFSMTPDPRFLVLSPSYNELLAGLYYGVEMSKGLVVLTGEVGSGKTTALRWMIQRFDSSVLADYIYNPHLTIDDLYFQLRKLLGITKFESKADKLHQIKAKLEERNARDLKTILIFDESHELSDEVLEEIRLLLNFESDTSKLLQIILSGQPELRERLRSQHLRQLKQRVSLRCKIPRLNRVSEVRDYIEERLKIAGSEAKEIFTSTAIDRIFQCSEGLPRQINNLCDNAMIAAYSVSSKTVTAEMVLDVADNLDMLPDRSALISSDKSAEAVESNSVLTQSGQGDLLVRRFTSNEEDSLGDEQ